MILAKKLKLNKNYPGKRNFFVANIIAVASRTVL
jgi:hypothetical protein